MGRWISAFLCAGALISVGHFIYGLTVRTATDQADRVDGQALPAAGEDPETAQELARVNFELARLRAQLEGKQDRADAPTDEEADEETEAPPHERPETWEERLTRVIQTYEQEPVEKGWSATMSGAVRDVFAAEAGAQDLLQSVECRSKTCRIELSEHASSPEAQKALPLIIHRLGRHFPQSTAEPVDPDDPHATPVIYFGS